MSETFAVGTVVTFERGLGLFSEGTIVDKYWWKEKRYVVIAYWAGSEETLTLKLESQCAHA